MSSQEKEKYTYTVLRYVPDIVSGEFANVGVVMYCPQSGQVYSRFASSMKRVTSFFPGVRAKLLKKHVNEVAKSIEKLQGKPGMLAFGDTRDVLDVAQRFLVKDDSSLQWSSVRGGVTARPEKTIEDLFGMFVVDKEGSQERSRRSEQDVWAEFKRSLPAKEVLKDFRSTVIKAKDDEIEFEHAWKNGVWHCLEPLSFDLSSEEGIKDKAHKWLGHMASLEGKRDEFKVYFLVGAPQGEELSAAYEKAINIMHKAPVDSELVEEREFIDFGGRLINDIVYSEGRDKAH